MYLHVLEHPADSTEHVDKTSSYMAHFRLPDAIG